MDFFKENKKMIIIVVLAALIQVIIITAILIDGNNEKELEAQRIKEEKQGNWEQQANFEEDFDIIEESKSKGYHSKYSGELEDQDVEGSDNDFGRVDVDLKFDDKKDNASKNQTTAKKRTTTVRSQNNNKLNLNTVENVKKAAIGRWKSVNNSDGKESDMYIEFFEDGSYQKYSEDREFVYTGKYTFNSPSRIKMTYETIELSISGTTQDNKSFAADINFKDQNNFSVKDLKRFRFSNFKKVK